jgi:hypothetical protein
MALMVAKEWEKYGWKRIDTFLKKYEDKSVFEVQDNPKALKERVNFVYDISMAKLAASRDVNNLKKIQLKDTKGRSWKIFQIFKSPEFGGAGASKTAKEDAALEDLKEQIVNAKKAEGTSTIKIKVGSKVYDVSDAVSTPGTPKSDFHLVDGSGKEVVWISHKDGKRARDFQQGGGMTESSEPEIFRHPETQKWLKDLSTLYPNGMPPGPTVFRKIKDKRLKMLSVYGNEFGRALSRQNTSLMLQGDVKLRKLGGYYEITAYHIHLNGDDLDGTEYEPVLTAKFTTGRKFGQLQNTRALILPEGSRKMNELPPLPG